MSLSRPMLRYVFVLIINNIPVSVVLSVVREADGEAVVHGVHEQGCDVAVRVLCEDHLVCWTDENDAFRAHTEEHVGTCGRHMLVFECVLNRSICVKDALFTARDQHMSDLLDAY